MSFVECVDRSSQTHEMSARVHSSYFGAARRFRTFELSFILWQVHPDGVHSEWFTRAEASRSRPFSILPFLEVESGGVDHNSDTGRERG